MIGRAGDSGKAQKDAIKSGLMAGAITQNQVGIGYGTVKAAVAAVDGEDVTVLIDRGFYYCDATNIDDPKSAAVLHHQAQRDCPGGFFLPN